MIDVGTVLWLVGAVILVTATGFAAGGALGAVFGFGAGLVGAGLFVNATAAAAVERARADRARSERERAGVA